MNASSTAPMYGAARPDQRADAAAFSPPPSSQRSALETTLNVASSAANLVLLPYVVAGRVAYQATSMAVTAPIKVTKRVLTGTWQAQETTTESTESTVDLFGEREAAMTAKSSTVDASDVDSSSSSDEAPMIEGILFEEQESDKTPPPSSSSSSSSSGVVSKLLFLPVRLVSTGVSTAAAMPASAISFGGKTISGAVSSSQALATSAIAASGGLVLRTSKQVASGITYGAFSTAKGVTGLVGSSVRTASYVVPESVSNAIWHGLATTSNVSTNVVAYSIAVPAFRMAQALVPEIDLYVTEQQCLDFTKDGVRMLVKVLGPQNAFYLLKRTYEVVNSEEVYDAFLLCQDLVRESLDAENYKKAGRSVSEATGVQTLVPVVKEIYKLIPSLDELVDAALVVGDVFDEIAKQVGDINIDIDTVKDTGRFELVSSGEEDEEDAYTFEGSSSEGDSMSTWSVADADIPVVTIVVDDDTFKGAQVEDAVDDSEEEEGIDEQVQAPEFGNGFGSSFSSSSPEVDLFSASMSFFTSVLDSKETVSLLNTFGDFVDLLVE